MMISKITKKDFFYLIVLTGILFFQVANYLELKPYADLCNSAFKELRDGL